MKLLTTISFLLISLVSFSQFTIIPNKDSIVFGDELNITISLNYPMEVGKAELPFFKVDSAIGTNFEVWEIAAPIKTSGEDPSQSIFHVEQKLVVSTFNTGVVVFEPIAAILDNDTIYSEPFIVQVDSVAVNMEAEIQDIADVLEDPLTFWESFSIWFGKNWWWVTILLLVGIGVLIFFRMRKKKRNQPLPSTPPIPLHEEFTLRHQQIVSKELWNENKHKEHYLELTDLIRQYYFKRFNVNTFDKTNKEIETITQSLPLSQDLKMYLAGLFNKSEFVKFAKEIPDITTIQLHNKITLDLILETKIKEEVSSIEE